MKPIRHITVAVPVSIEDVAREMTDEELFAELTRRQHLHCARIAKWLNERWQERSSRRLDLSAIVDRLEDAIESGQTRAIERELSMLRDPQRVLSDDMRVAQLYSEWFHHPSRSL